MSEGPTVDLYLGPAARERARKRRNALAAFFVAAACIGAVIGYLAHIISNAL